MGESGYATCESTGRDSGRAHVLFDNTDEFRGENDFVNGEASCAALVSSGAHVQNDADTDLLSGFEQCRETEDRGATDTLSMRTAWSCATGVTGKPLIGPMSKGLPRPMTLR